MAWVLRYVEEARPVLVLHPDELALFLSRHGVRIGPNGLRRRIHRLFAQAGVRSRAFGSCHLLRHTCATLMLEAGADIRYIQEMLGHAKLDTTEIYTRVSIQKLKDVHTATHPGARLARRGDPERDELLEALAEEALEEGVEEGEDAPAATAPGGGG